MLSPLDDSTQSERIVKVIMVGAPKAGKSSLMRRYDDLEFDPTYIPTTAGDFTAKCVDVDDVAVSFQIWDVGGSGVLGKSFLRGTHGVLLVADVTSKPSLKILNSLYESVKRLVGFADDSFPCIVVANKLDLVMDGEHDSVLRQISLDGLRRWANARRSETDTPIEFFEVSAKNGTNVSTMFESMIRMALYNPGKLLPLELRTSTTSNSQRDENNFTVDDFSGEKYLYSNKELDKLPSKKFVNPMLESELSILDIGDEEQESHSRKLDDYGYDNYGNSNSNENSNENGNENGNEEENEEEEQAIAKVILAGAAAVGKSFILKRFVKDDKDQNDTVYEPTMGADLRIVDMPVKDRTLTLQIWDTSGSPKMFTMGRSIYR